MLKHDSECENLCNRDVEKGEQRCHGQQVDSAAISSQHEDSEQGMLEA